jgi:uncharacterized membrane protein
MRLWVVGNALALSTCPQAAARTRDVVLPVQAVQAQQTFQVWPSPYPPPEARYEKVLPGSFDRILRMVENLQQAQIDQTGRAAAYAHSDTKRGQWLGFALGGIACVGTVICLALGNPWVAGLFLSLPLMEVAKALIETAKALSYSAVTSAPARPNPTPPPAPSPPTESRPELADERS